MHLLLYNILKQSQSSIMQHHLLEWKYRKQIEAGVRCIFSPVACIEPYLQHWYQLSTILSGQWSPVLFCVATRYWLLRSDVMTTPPDLAWQRQCSTFLKPSDVTRYRPMLPVVARWRPPACVQLFWGHPLSPDIARCPSLSHSLSTARNLNRPSILPSTRNLQIGQ